MFKYKYNSKSFLAICSTAYEVEAKYENQTFIMVFSILDEQDPNSIRIDSLRNITSADLTNPDVSVDHLAITGINAIDSEIFLTDKQKILYRILLNDQPTGSLNTRAFKTIDSFFHVFARYELKGTSLRIFLGNNDLVLELDWSNRAGTCSVLFTYTLPKSNGAHFF